MHLPACAGTASIIQADSCKLSGMATGISRPRRGLGIAVGMAFSGTNPLFGFDGAAASSDQSAEAIVSAAQQFGQEDHITVLTLTRLSISDHADMQVRALSSPLA